MPRPGYRTDKGGKFNHVDKPLVLRGASQIEYPGVIAVWEDFVATPKATGTVANNVVVAQSGTALTTAVIDVTAGAPVAGHGGWLGGKTDDVDAEIDEIALAAGSTSGWMVPSRAGNGVLISEIAMVIPTALTTRQYFVGVSDDPSEGTGTNGSLNISGTYTQVSPATDAAGFIFSSLATNPTIWKYSSVNADVDATVSAATETITGVVDAYTVHRVEIDSAGNAYFYQSTSGSASVGRQEPTMVGSTALAVATTALLCPILTAAPTTTTGVEWEIDYMFGATPR